MNINDVGKIADECWIEIPKHFPNAVLHEYVVMPNHVHGIIELTNDAVNVVVGAENVGAENVGAENFLPLRQRNDTVIPVGVQNFEPVQENFESEQENLQPQPPKQNAFQKMIPRSIGSIVKGFKIGVTIRSKHVLPDIKIWQRNYHEHIIRNEQSYQTISAYIINNPAKWNDDKFYNQ